MPHRQHSNPNAAAPAAERKRRRRPRRLDWVDGTLVALDADSGRLTLRVDDARRPGLTEGTELEIDAAAARVEASDGDGDGRPGLRDLFPGDRLRVELEPAAQSGSPQVARRLRQQSAGAPVGGLRRLWEERVSN